MSNKNKVIIRTTQDYIDEISKNIYFKAIPDDAWAEAQIDSFVEKDILGTLYKAKVVFQKKTGNKTINRAIPSKTSDTGTGEIDVMIYNIFSDKNIDLVVENKVSTINVEAALEEAIVYTDGGKVYQSRVAIGYNGKQALLRVKVNRKWKPLYINGVQINAFIGPTLLEMIYKYPDNNVFILDASQFTQREFHKILETLRTYYRNISGLLADNDNARIDFTIAFIALKMISEKERIEYHGSSYGWEKLNKAADIKAAVDAINFNDKYSKYRDVFTIAYNEKSKVPAFDFQEIISELESETIEKLHKKVNEIPQMHALPIDLFGEVYEVLASKKTKRELGEFFTRRHIIRPLLNIFVTDSDVEKIISAFKAGNALSIVDPFCGTGGFLTEFFKVLKQRITPDEKIDIANLASQSFFGFDLNPSNATRTKINMYLAGDGVSEVSKRDSLATRSSDVIRGLDVDLEHPEKFDFVATNVPYGKGKIAIKGDVTANKRMEVNALFKIVQILKPTGKALVIIPDGVLEAPSLSPIRDWFVRNCKIDFICSLPKFAFAPYTKEKTYAVAFTKRKTPFADVESQFLRSEKFWAYIVDNDGYANSDKRFETGLKDDDGRWLHNELAVWYDENGIEQPSLIEEKFLIGEQPEGEQYYDEWNQDILGKKYGFISLGDVLQDFSISYKKITKFKPIFSDFSRASRELLKDEKLLLSKVSNKEHLMVENDVSEEYSELIGVIDVFYDKDEACFYDLRQPIKTYQINLLPEKYFRTPKVQLISPEELHQQVTSLEEEIKALFKE